MCSYGRCASRPSWQFLLNTHQAARWLGPSAKTLARYRVAGTGPVFHRFGGRIRYLRLGAKQVPVCASTQELGKPSLSKNARFRSLAEFSNWSYDMTLT